MLHWIELCLVFHISADNIPAVWHRATVVLFMWHLQKLISSNKALITFQRVICHRLQKDAAASCFSFFLFLRRLEIICGFFLSFFFWAHRSLWRWWLVLFRPAFDSSPPPHSLTGDGVADRGRDWGSFTPSWAGYSPDKSPDPRSAEQNRTERRCGRERSAFARERCVCVCECLCEGERKGKKVYWSVLARLLLRVRAITSRLLCASQWLNIFSLACHRT